MKNRKRNRMQGFDYSTDNLYFVTICVKDRVCCLGVVVDVGTGRDKIKEGTARELSVQVQDKEIKIKSLSSLIGAFKTTSPKMIHQVGFADFAWQRSFHDHIIRNERSFQNISNYINLNPEKWIADTFFEKH